MTFSFRPAARSEAKPLIGLFSESGAGKTYSALLLARGFVGPEGRVGMIETESGRGEAYADPAEYPELRGPDPLANYEVLSLREDFSPQAYGKAISAAETAKLDALVIDSASHEWEGANGVLAMAAANGAAGKKGVLMWQDPKTQHKRHFMLRFMQTPIPLVILCMRAKYPMKEVPKQGGGKEWVRCAELEPTQADDILFEMFVHGWISQGDHRFHMSKCTAKSLEPVFGGNRPLSLDTGRQLAEWARGAAPSRSTRPPAQSTASPYDEALAEAAKGVAAFRDWWNGAAITKAKRDAVRPRLKELQRVAAEADEARKNPVTEEDPFGLPPPASDAGEKIDTPPDDAADDKAAAFDQLLADLDQCGSIADVTLLSDKNRGFIVALPDEMRGTWSQALNKKTAALGRKAAAA